MESSQIERIVKELRDLREACEEHAHSGRCTDYAEYAGVCGKITAYKHAEAIFRQAMADAEEGENA